MVKNPDYFGGAPYLDGLKFVNSIADAGGDSDVTALSTGTFNMAFLRDPAAVAAAHDKKFEGVSTFEQGGGILLINQGNSVTCAGGQPCADCAPASPTAVLVSNPPTKDPKIRQAIAAAVDPKVINERGYQGKGLVGNQLFQSDFRWYTDAADRRSISRRPETGHRSKAAGWDGKLRLLYNSSPTGPPSGSPPRRCCKTSA